MRMKTFGMLAVSGLLTVAFAYAVPAIADDTAAMGAAPSDQTTPAADNNAMQMQNQTNSTAQTDANAPSTPTTGNDSSSDTTADMPSGDDDY